MALVTKLLPNPRTKRKKAAMQIVAAVYERSIVRLLASATKKGVKGINPNIQKLKNVTIMRNRRIKKIKVNINRDIAQKVLFK